MNTCCQTALTASSAPAPAARGLFASLEQLINTASFASVDLTDTVFAHLPRRDGAPLEAVVPPNCSE